LLTFYGIKLKLYDIIDNAYAVIKSYHNDRYQRVLSDSHTSSEWAKFKDGVPLGSLLGPGLFLLYINGLPEVVNENTEPVLFAADTSIIVSNPNLVNFKNNLIPSFQQLNAWSDVNLLPNSFYVLKNSFNGKH
jgi:hypothetical protein